MDSSIQWFDKLSWTFRHTRNMGCRARTSARRRKSIVQLAGEIALGPGMRHAKGTALTSAFCLYPEQMYRPNQ